MWDHLVLKQPCIVRGNFKWTGGFLGIEYHSSNWQLQGLWYWMEHGLVAESDLPLLNISDVVNRIKVWWFRRPFHFSSSLCLIILVNNICYVLHDIIQVCIYGPAKWFDDWVKTLILTSDTSDLNEPFMKTYNSLKP